MSRDTVERFKATTKSILEKCGYKISRIKPPSDIIPRDVNEEGFNDIIEEDFVDIFHKCKRYTMTSTERMYALYQATKYVSQNRVPGDIVECGVWRGGSSMVSILTLINMNDTARKIYLYDTYAGMSKPTEKDIDIDGLVAIDYWREHRRGDYTEWGFVPLEEVKKNVFSTGYSRDNLLFVKGKVEDTIPRMIPEKIAILRLDTDFYESTYHELKYLFPMLSKRGVLIIDDYGHYKGAREATDQYMRENSVEILLNRIDYSCRIGVRI